MQQQESHSFSLPQASKYADFDAEKERRANAWHSRGGYRHHHGAYVQRDHDRAQNARQSNGPNAYQPPDHPKAGYNGGHGAVSSRIYGDRARESKTHQAHGRYARQMFPWSNWIIKGATAGLSRNNWGARSYQEKQPDKRGIPVQSNTSSTEPQSGKDKEANVEWKLKSKLEKAEFIQEGCDNVNIRTHPYKFGVINKEGKIIDPKTFKHPPRLLDRAEYDAIVKKDVDCPDVHREVEIAIEKAIKCAQHEAESLPRQLQNTNRNTVEKSIQLFIPSAVHAQSSTKAPLHPTDVPTFQQAALAEQASSNEPVISVQPSSPTHMQADPRPHEVEGSLNSISAEAEMRMDKDPGPALDTDSDLLFKKSDEGSNAGVEGEAVKGGVKNATANLTDEGEETNSHRPSTKDAGISTSTDASSRSHMAIETPEVQMEKVVLQSEIMKPCQIEKMQICIELTQSKFRTRTSEESHTVESTQSIVSMVSDNTVQEVALQDRMAQTEIMPAAKCTSRSSKLLTFNAEVRNEFDLNAAETRLAKTKACLARQEYHKATAIARDLVNALQEYNTPAQGPSLLNGVMARAYYYLATISHAVSNMEECERAMLRSYENAFHFPEILQQLLELQYKLYFISNQSVSSPKDATAASFRENSEANSDEFTATERFLLRYIKGLKGLHHKRVTAQIRSAKRALLSKQKVSNSVKPKEQVQAIGKKHDESKNRNQKTSTPNLAVSHSKRETSPCLSAMTLTASVGDKKGLAKSTQRLKHQVEACFISRNELGKSIQKIHAKHAHKENKDAAAKGNANCSESRCPTLLANSEVFIMNERKNLKFLHPAGNVHQVQKDIPDTWEEHIELVEGITSSQKIRSPISKSDVLSTISESSESRHLEKESILEENKKTPEKNNSRSPPKDSVEEVSNLTLIKGRIMQVSAESITNSFSGESPSVHDTQGINRAAQEITYVNYNEPKGLDTNFQESCVSATLLQACIPKAMDACHSGNSQRLPLEIGHTLSPKKLQELNLKGCSDEERVYEQVSTNSIGSNATLEPSELEASPLKVSEDCVTKLTQPHTFESKILESGHAELFKCKENFKDIVEEATLTKTFTMQSVEKKILKSSTVEALPLPSFEKNAAKKSETSSLESKKLEYEPVKALELHERSQHAIIHFYREESHENLMLKSSVEAPPLLSPEEGPLKFQESVLPNEWTLELEHPKRNEGLETSPEAVEDSTNPKKIELPEPTWVEAPPLQSLELSSGKLSELLLSSDMALESKHSHAIEVKEGLTESSKHIKNKKSTETQTLESSYIEGPLFQLSENDAKQMPESQSLVNESWAPEGSKTLDLHRTSRQEVKDSIIDEETHQGMKDAALEFSHIELSQLQSSEKPFSESSEVKPLKSIGLRSEHPAALEVKENLRTISVDPGTRKSIAQSNQKFITETSHFEALSLQRFEEPRSQNLEEQSFQKYGLEPELLKSLQLHQMSHTIPAAKPLTTFVENMVLESTHIEAPPLQLCEAQLKDNAQPQTFKIDSLLVVDPEAWKFKDNLRKISGDCAAAKWVTRSIEKTSSESTFVEAPLLQVSENETPEMSQSETQAEVVDCASILLASETEPDEDRNLGAPNENAFTSQGVHAGIGVTLHNNAMTLIVEGASKERISNSENAETQCEDFGNAAVGTSLDSAFSKKSNFSIKDNSGSVETCKPRVHHELSTRQALAPSPSLMDAVESLSKAFLLVGKRASSIELFEKIQFLELVMSCALAKSMPQEFINHDTSEFIIIEDGQSDFHRNEYSTKHRRIQLYYETNPNALLAAVPSREQQPICVIKETLLLTELEMPTAADRLPEPHEVSLLLDDYNDSYFENFTEKSCIPVKSKSCNSQVAEFLLGTIEEDLNAVETLSPVAEQISSSTHSAQVSLQAGIDTKVETELNAISVPVTHNRVENSIDTDFQKSENETNTVQKSEVAVKKASDLLQQHPFTLKTIVPIEDYTVNTPNIEVCDKHYSDSAKTSITLLQSTANSQFELGGQPCNGLNISQLKVTSTNPDHYTFGSSQPTKNFGSINELRSNTCRDASVGTQSEMHGADIDESLRECQKPILPSRPSYHRPNHWLFMSMSHGSATYGTKKNIEYSKSHESLPQKPTKNFTVDVTTGKKIPSKSDISVLTRV